MAKNIKVVENLWALIEADDLHGKIEFRGPGNWEAFVWLRKYARSQGKPDIDHDLLRNLGKIVIENHGISWVRVLNLSLVELRVKLREAGFSNEIVIRKSECKRCRLSVQIERPTIAILGEKEFKITEPMAIYLDEMIKAEGHYISGPEIFQKNDLFPPDRVDRVRKKLPIEIRELVETKKGMGSRLKAEAWLS
jgi:hypothetical protein